MKMFLLLSFSLFIVLTNAQLGCRNEKNELVDWFYLYKLPVGTSGSKENFIGIEYVYLTSDDSLKWQRTNLTLNDTQSLPGQTISQLYGNNSIASIMYSDQPPPDRTSKNSFAHAKGVIAADATSGFWLDHSVPGYTPPLKTGTYSYPVSGLNYGQSFICISMNSENINKVAEQMLYDKVYVYSSFLPDTLNDTLFNFVQVLNSNWVTKSPYFKVIDVVSSNGTKFKTFGKSAAFADDLYAGFVAPELNTNLYVEAWRLGVGNMATNCSKYNVYNIQEIRIPEIDFTFTTTKDHSKWAVGDDNYNPWICVGDINRQTSQGKRGGGTICQKNVNVWNAYRKLVNSYESCALISIDIKITL